MASKKRTCRVPKKVAQRASAALEVHREDGVGLDGAQGVFVAQALSSSVPVTVDVPQAMATFFSSGWRYDPRKVAQAGLYGGEFGQQWSKRVASMLATAEPEAESAQDEVSVDELFEFTDEETDAIVAFLTGISEVVPEATDALEAISEGTEEMLETELDSDEEDDEVDETTPEEEAAEAAMVQAALDEVAEDGGSLDELTATDFTADAMAARERMAQASLVRARSLAMAKMASNRMAVAAAAPAAPAPEGVAAPADADPKALPAEPHHAASQPRDWHGRFAKVGARVRSHDGNLGYVKKVEGDQLIITDDEGNDHKVPAKDIEVVTVKSPARLPQPMPLVEDPKGRLEAYLEWAKEQMGITAAGLGPATITPGSQPSPWFGAIVDAVDPSAVVNLLAIIPKPDGSGLRAFERKGGGWVEAPDFIRDLNGLTPPAVVELDRDTLLAVIEQIDAYDKKKAAS